MKIESVIIEDEGYGKMEWFNATVTLDSEDEINVSLCIDDTGRIIEVTVTDDIPDGITEHEIEQAVIKQYENES